MRNNQVSVRHIELSEGVELQASCGPVMRSKDLQDLLMSVKRQMAISRPFECESRMHEVWRDMVLELGIGIGSVGRHFEKCKILPGHDPTAQESTKRDYTHCVNDDGSQVFCARSGRKAQAGIGEEGTITRKRRASSLLPWDSTEADETGEDSEDTKNKNVLEVANGGCTHIRTDTTRHVHAEDREPCLTVDTGRRDVAQSFASVEWQRRARDGMNTPRDHLGRHLAVDLSDATTSTLSGSVCRHDHARATRSPARMAVEPGQNNQSRTGPDGRQRNSRQKSGSAHAP